MAEAQKIHVLQMEHWYVPGAVVRAFTTHEAAERAAIDLFNETMLEDLNGRITEFDGLPERKPVTKIAEVPRLMDWANDRCDWAAACQITTVDLEGSA